MKVGLVGFVHRDSFLGTAIEVAQNIEHKKDGFTPTHVFGSVGKDGLYYIIEADTPKVKETIYIESEYWNMKKNVRYIDLGFNEEELKLFTEFLLAQVGKPYDYLGTGLFQPIHIFLAKVPVISKIYHRNWWGIYGKNYKRWYCSRLYAKAINYARPGTVKSPDDITPDELFDQLKVKYSLYKN